MNIVAITGGRDRTPTLAELELARPHIEAADTMREGEARGTDKAVAAWVRARGLARVEPFPADWDAYKDRPGKNPAGAIRNRLMLEGEHPPQLELGTRCVEGPRVGRVDKLVAFAGNVGTKDCLDHAGGIHIPVVEIAPVEEPRVWNRHHGPAPEPSMYIGGCKRDPDRSSPLANPWPLELRPGETRAAAAVPALDRYRRWLWRRIRDLDEAVLAALDTITAKHHLVCSCWPRACHGEVVVGAWRWRNLCERVGEDQARAMLKRLTAAQALAELEGREQRAPRTCSVPS